MSKIYGFGNALIDIEIQINEDQLNSIGIPKGGMQHISRDRKDYLLENYKNSIKSKTPGGSIANSLFAAEDFGASTYFSCSLGDDEYGQLFLDSYEDKDKIFFNYSDDPTGVCLVFVSPDGERTMASNLSANNQLSAKCISPALLDSCDYLLFDNFSLATDSGNQTVDYCLGAISDEVKVCFGLADSGLIVDNLSKIKNLGNTNLHFLSGNKLENETLDQFASLNYKKRLISNGEKGASINGKQLCAPKIDLINANGAGDSLVGAFLAREGKMEDEQALKEAINYSSQVCSVNTPRLK